MGHKVLIGGTSYEITGGRDLIGGTAFDRKAGKCFVGGTTYNIPFARYVTVTITGNGGSCASVTIGGVTYTSATVIEVERGAEVECSAKVVGDASAYTTITYNGHTVQRGNDISYTFAAKRDVSIELTYTANNSTPPSRKGIISITT